MNGQYVTTSMTKVGEFFGVGRPTVDAWRKQGMPGVKNRYDLQEVAQWLQGTQRAVNGSDALERQRHERARMLEIERRKMEGSLVEVSVVIEALRPFAQHLRRTSDYIQREYGRGAARAINEAIDLSLAELDDLDGSEQAGKTA